MATLKVLQLEPWMEWSFKNDQQELLEMGYVETTPRFNRNGWYRHIGFSWFEIEGRAFYHPDLTRLAEDFDFQLKQLHHIPLTNDNRKAIKQLMTDKLAPKSMKELYYADTDWRSIREVRRTSWFSVNRMIKKINKGKKNA